MLFVAEAKASAEALIATATVPSRWESSITVSSAQALA
jgi:hypothetical protein